MTYSSFTKHQCGSTCNFAEYISRAVCIVTEALGIFTMIFLVSLGIKELCASWSPTETARQCFNYPAPYSPPWHEDTVSFLLSSAFFGSDALYFDSGEENTGIGEMPYVGPSGTSGESLPQQPIDEPYTDTPPNEISNIYEYDRSVLKDGEVALLPYDLSGGARRGEVMLSNTTSYVPDVAGALASGYPVSVNLSDYSADKPLILIIHTHGTESYSPEGVVSALPTDARRTSDTSQNMVAVGAVMADILNGAGIPTVHCEIMHDLESYTRAYDLAADTIQKYIAKYPSIKYVFDVHRDAIARSNGDLIRPLTLINGKPAAQVMLLVGTNEKGADHPEWNTNFTVAVKLQNKLTTDYDRFARPINIRGASFNEQFTPGSLLIEIGSAANSLSEAKIAAEHLTYSIIDMIKENPES